MSNPETPMPHTAKKRSVKNLWREYRGTLVFFGLMLCFRSAWADWVDVPTGSMNPTIYEGDRVLVDKHSFGLRVPFTHVRLTAGEDPVRGDIVVFDSPQDGTSLVKRVAAVPGDVVMLDGESLIVNGQRLRYGPGEADHLRELPAATREQSPIVLREDGAGIDHEIMLLPGRMGGRSFGPVTVPNGMYVMLGDNRDNSADSRYFGFVPRRNILGRATRVVISLNPDNRYLPRSDRLLVPLK
jgi:signal peptidase I